MSESPDYVTSGLLFFSAVVVTIAVELIVYAWRKRK